MTRNQPQIGARFFSLAALGLALLTRSCPGASSLDIREESGAYQATGIKISEPTASSVSIWTRVTRRADRIADDGPLPVLHVYDRTSGKELPIKDNARFANGRPVVTFATGSDLGSLRGAAPGATGQT
ncbi:MAG: hypothetical protein WCS94_25075, partial [Verrucomicrobiota bacterium]